MENQLKKTKAYKIWRDIEGKFITGPFGSEFNVGNYTKNGKCRYIRGKDVKDFFLTDNDNVYIPEKDFKRLNKYALQNEDILVSVVGTLGNVSIVDDYILPAIFSCKSTVFRTKSINPYYFISYLNSKYGKKLLERSVRGAVQTGLNINDLKDLLIFVPSPNTQKEIGEIVEKSKMELENSKSLYSQAENLLLEELGLKDYKSENELWNVVNLSEVKKANRIDADYFDPKYQKLEAKIKKYEHKQLGKVLENIPAKFEPTKQPDKLFKYVELSNINASTGIIDGFSEVLGKETPNRAKRLLKQNDVIVSSVEGSLGKVALVHNDQKDFLASTGFFQFRSKEILPEVLLILAKSIVFQWQLEKRCAGTILTAVPKESIKDILVPILPKSTQQKIVDLVRQSHEARKKAKQLLEEAKRKVEELIENG
ncbi:MAG: restriction endonuclease subunit S [Candidatus Vogelbacteria bacterium]